MLFSSLSEYYERLEGVSSRLSMIDIMTEMFSKASKEELCNIVYMTQGVLGPPFKGIETGIAEKFTEAAIGIATGFSKEHVYDEYKKAGDMGSVAEKLVSNTKLRRMENRKLEVNDVFNTMKSIAGISGEGSQDKKIRHLAHLIASSTPLEARYIVRLALGTLRLGAGDATILEALSKLATGSREFKGELENAYNTCSDLGRIADVLAKHGADGIKDIRVELFSPIRPALAERLPTAEEILKKMGDACSVESKYDGMRTQVHMSKKGKKVVIFSRNLETVTDMFPDIAEAALKDIDAEEAIFEGEAIAYDEIANEFHAFQETIQRKRKHGVKEKSKELPLKLFAFDLLYVDGEQYTNKEYEKRRKKLESIIKKGEVIRLSDNKVVTKPGELEHYFDEAIGKGLEGIVAKDLHAPYVAGARKFSWIKMKRSYKSELSDTVDLVVIGYYLGRGTRAEFQFGGLLGAVYNEDRDMFETITRIGTGFTEQQMEMFRDLLGKIKIKNKPVRVDSLVEPDFWVEPKYIVTVRADEITRSPMHTCGRGKNEGGDEVGYALRFPRIVSDGIRKDKSVNDTTTTSEIVEMFKQQRKTRIEK